MAGYPPSYPPPTGQPPLGFDPRKQARYYRDQARIETQARRNAERAQRELYRQQTRGLRRQSVLGPLLLLTVGTVALIVSTGRLSILSFELWYGRWWPLVIVAAGLLLVGEWAFDQWSARDGAPYVRRGIGGGGVFLLLLLIFGGLTAKTVHSGSDFIVNGLSINRDNIDEVFGEKYEREQQIDQALAPGTSLAISNPHGDVVVTGQSRDNSIHITVNKVVYSSSEELANNKATRLAPSLSLTGSVLNVTVPAIDGAIANLSIAIPASAQTTISADRGDVRISSLQAAINVTSNHGDVQVDDVTGTIGARVNNSHSSFTAHGVTGDVSVHGRGEGVTLANVSGRVELDGEFFGDTHLEHLGGLTTFHTSRTYLSLTSLPGQIDISPDSELSGHDLKGPTELRTRSRNISLQNVAGSISVMNTNGTVDLTVAVPAGSIQVQNKNGAVNVSLPENAGVAIDAATKDGHVADAFPPQAISVSNHAELHGTVGDGSVKVSLQTTNGDITIQKESGHAANAP